MSRRPSELVPDGTVHRALCRVLRHLRVAKYPSAEALAGELHMTGSALLKIEQGVNWPGPEVVQQLDAALRAGGILVRLYEDAVEERSRDAYSTPGIGNDDEMRRRQALGLLGGTLGAPVADQMETLRRGADAALGSAASERDADEWERTVAEHARDVGWVSSSALLPGLLADFGEVKARLAETSPSDLRHRLTGVSAQLAVLVAITLTALGDPRTARRWWRTATRAADTVDDARLASLVRGRRAVFSLYDDRPRLSVVELAEDAVSFGNGRPCVGVVSGHAARCQALAELGRGEEAVDALHDLVDLYERLPDSVTTDRVSQWGWSEQRLRHVESMVYAYVGDLQRAAQAQDAALALYPAASSGGAIQIQMYRAACHIRGGDPTAGARHLVSTIQGLPPWEQTDALVVRSAVMALGMVPDKAAALPAVREARELLSSARGVI